MEFRFFDVSKSMLATSALALVTSLIWAPVATAQAAGGQAAGQTAAPQKNYKDRGEYDLYSKITQTQDPKARLELLNTWQDKYPQSDFADDRLIYYINTLAQLAPSDANGNSRKLLLEKSSEMLKLNPKYFLADYYTALWGPIVGGSSPSSDVTSQVDAAAHGMLDLADTTFAADKKPTTTSQADWDKAKNTAMGIAHNALAWEATSKKDTATAENEYKASLQANPNQGRVSYLYAKLLMDEKKYAEALFEYARAAEYTGSDSVPAGAQPQVLDYFKKVYAQYHGSADGADQVLAQAKTSALPPDGFSIVGQGDIAKAKADELQKRIDSDPAFKLWYSVKQSLTGDNGDAFFNSSVKGTELPGGAEGVKNFSGTIISVDPADKPTKVVLGIEDPATPDATLTFTNPLPANAVKVGDKLEFSGIPDSYTKDPYMLTFKDPNLPGVKTTAPPKAPVRRRPRAK